MAEPRRSRKGLKICCGVSLTAVTIIVVVTITLIFTVFKPKNPLIIPQSAKLEKVEFQMFPSISLNATLGLNMTVQNKNYARFQFKNTTTYVEYRGIGIVEVPLEEGKVPARGDLNISVVANITAEKLVGSPYFWEDVGSGRLNFSSTATLHGKASVIKIFKLGAEVIATCDISVEILTQDVDVSCASKLKM